MRHFYVPLVIALAFVAGAILSPLHHDRAGAQAVSPDSWKALRWKEIGALEAVCRNRGGVNAFGLSPSPMLICHDGSIWQGN